jgi:hypothetical protein
MTFSLRTFLGLMMLSALGGAARIQQMGSVPVFPISSKVFRRATWNCMPLHRLESR